MRDTSICRAVLIASLMLFVNNCSEQKAATTRDIGASAIPVEIQIITPQYLEHTIVTTGTLLADEEIELRPEISGRIVALNFEEGSQVRKGDLLMKISDRDLVARLKRNDLEEALASDEEKRARQLREVDGISQEEYDRIQNRLQLIQAEKEELRAEIAKTEIIAPFDGVIGLRSVSEGGYATPSMLAASLQDVDPIKVEFSVPEKYAGMLKPGQLIKAQIGDLDSVYTGEVYAVEAKIDPSTRTIRARATIPNKKRDLVPGSFARIEITLERIESAIVVPSQAIVPQLEGARVYLVKDGKASFTPVQAGIRTENSVQIISGIAPNDSLILTGLLQLSDGKAVKALLAPEAVHP